MIMMPTRLLLTASKRMIPFKTGVRFLMDAKTRPSHSQMFVKQQQQQTPDPTPEWHVYFIIAQRVALAWGMIHVVTEYGVDVTLCEGPSMMPTIHEYGEMLLVDKFCWQRVKDGETIPERAQAARQRQEQHTPGILWHEPMLPRLYQRKGCVIVDTADDINRVSWMEAFKHWFVAPLDIGDVVVANHPNRPGTICKRVAGLPGDRIILKRTGRLETVPNGHVWLEGDNAYKSNDSRHYGAIPLALLQGRAIARIWPLRGSAWMQRLRTFKGSTVLPAGYQGEHIARSKKEFDAMVKDAEEEDSEETS